jgi:hypothetical protein
MGTGQLEGKLATQGSKIPLMWRNPMKNGNWPRGVTPAWGFIRHGTGRRSIDGDGPENVTQVMGCGSLVGRGISACLGASFWHYFMGLMPLKQEGTALFRFKYP